ncbi:carboxylesterase [Aureimonas endophytica]|uniref:Carboxylesterase n=1 Tax=Aureimonas endophytica TaxID=2027858 RepID=A0A916ZNM0_9HYPH|nr:alpha/beta fold hydrolase [Aureimonas endophytica]GGE04467.1 carboxylesterase [Aureimonas endophytica]
MNAPLHDAILSGHGFAFPGGDAALLLVHGLGGTPAEMKLVGRRIAQAGFTVHGLKLPGHCGTEADLLATRWTDWAEATVAAAERLTRRHEKVFVGGLSMGALLALHAAAELGPALRGTLLYSPTLFYDGWSIPRGHVLLPPALALGFGRFYRFREAHPYGLKDDRLRERIVAAMTKGRSEEAGLLDTPGQSLHQLLKLIRAVKARLPAIAVPSLIVQAVEDDVSSPRNARYLQRRLGGPAEIEFLHDSYHMITVDRERDRVADLSLAFLRRHGAPSGIAAVAPLVEALA